MRKLFEFLVVALPTIILPAQSAFAHGEMECAAPGATVPTHHDTIPNFVFGSPLSSVRDGRWDDPATWSLGRKPAAADRVIISHVVTLDSASAEAQAVGVYPNGTLTFAPNVNTKLAVGTLQVFCASYLKVGTKEAPIQASVSAQIEFTGARPAGIADVDQWGGGLIGFGGHVFIHGTSLGETSARLVEEAVAGATSVRVSGSIAGWAPGQRILFPDSRQKKTNMMSKVRIGGAIEEVFIRSVEGLSDGTTRIGLAAPLAYSHPGIVSQIDSSKRYFPSVMNVSRNVILSSRDPGTPEIPGARVVANRGHVALGSSAVIDIRYASFIGLGRTTTDPLDPKLNHIGRYPLHIHHARGPAQADGYTFHVVGNYVRPNYVGAALFPVSNGGTRWGIVIHGSHYGYIAQNVVDGAGGSNIFVEDSSESNNMFYRNATLRSINGGSYKLGLAGDGLWFKGPLNFVIENSAYNHADSGITYYLQKTRTVKIPPFAGADDAVFVSVNGQLAPLGSDIGNEIWTTNRGYNIWDLGIAARTASVPRSKILSAVVIGTAFEGIFTYNVANLDIENFVMLGRTLDVSQRPRAIKYELPRAGMVHSRDLRNVRIINAHMEGIGGVALPGASTTKTASADHNLSIEGNTKVMASTGVLLTAQTADTRIRPRVVRIERGTAFHPFPPSVPAIIAGQRNVVAQGTEAAPAGELISVTDYRGAVGDSFNVHRVGFAPCAAPVRKPGVVGDVCPVR